MTTMRFKNIAILTAVCIAGVLWLAGFWRSGPGSPESYADTGAWFTTGQEADLMLSGVDFNNSGGPLLFNHPTGIASDGRRFLLCDRFNNRVLIWNTLPDRWDAPPDLVLGQADLLSNNAGTGRSGLNWPGNVSVSPGGVVAVADTENDRILIWREFPVRNAEPADVSISLPALSPPGSPNRYGWPWGVWTDGTRLAAVATHGSALLFWNSLPSSDDRSPDYLIRLPQFGTPRNISTDGSTYFFVGDHNAQVGNNQPSTYFWNSYPTKPDQPFDFYRSEWVKGTRLPGGGLVAGGLSSVYFWNSAPTAAGVDPDLTVRYPSYANGDGPDVVFAGGRLYVNNYNGNNVHVYNTIPTQPSQRPDFALGSPSVDYNTLGGMNYIQNPVVAVEGDSLVVSSDFERKLWIWKSLPRRSGTPPDVRISLFDQNLAPWDNALRGERLVLQPAADAAVTGVATKYLGHFVAGGGYTSRLGLVNLDETSQEFTISLRNDDGALLGSPLKVSVPADGAAAIAGVSPFRLESGTASLVQGYLRIEGSNGRFVGQAVIGDPGEAGFGTSLAAAWPRGGEIRYAQAANTDLWYTGAALLNPAEQAAPVCVVLFDPRGKVLACRNLAIAARSRWTGLLSQLFAGLPAIEAGYLRIGTGQPGLSVAVIGATDLSSLVTISQ